MGYDGDWNREEKDHGNDEGEADKKKNFFHVKHLLQGTTPRQVLTRGQLLEKLWDIDERFVDEHTLTTSISRIRSKIESDGGAPYIKTVYGMGYQWTGGEAK